MSQNDMCCVPGIDMPENLFNVAVPLTIFYINNYLECFLYLIYIFNI